MIDPGVLRGARVYACFFLAIGDTQPMPIIDTAPRPHLDARYAHGFVKECLDRGIDEETTAVALFEHLMNTAIKEDPEFARGFQSELQRADA